MTLISYRGELAAIAGPRRLLFACLDLDAAPDSDPHRRFVLAMGLFAHDIERGRRRGPYTDAAAEAFARDRLMPEHAFREAATGRTAEQLAAAFNVPLEQVRQRCAELAQPPDPARDEQQAPKRELHGSCARAPGVARVRRQAV